MKSSADDVQPSTSGNINNSVAKFDTLSIGGQDRDSIESQVFPRYKEPSGQYFFPRCEYNTRFDQTSVFEMSSSCYWRTYPRSTSTGGECARYVKQMPNTYTNQYTNKVNETKNGKIRSNYTKNGTVRSVWNGPCKTIFKSKEEAKQLSKISSATNVYSEIYDKLLEYKWTMCDAVVTGFYSQKSNENNITAHFNYNNPCILVQVIRLKQTFPKGKDLPESSNIYKILMAYFTAITNHIAQNNGIPTELVIRESFGHNIPSVSDIQHSFRINIGTISKHYAEKVLVQSLIQFNEDCLQFLDAKLNFEPSQLVVINENIREYNRKKTEVFMKKKNQEKNRTENVRKKRSNVGARKGKVEHPSMVEFWTENDTVFKLLRKTGDSYRGKISKQITRKRQYIDLLANYFHEELKNDAANMVTPLKKILLHLNYKNDDDVVTLMNNGVRLGNDQFIIEKTSFDEANNDIQTDVDFWNIIGDISSAFEQRNINILTEIVKNRRLLGLYGWLEEANLQFIRNSGEQNANSGYGSSSDCEAYHNREQITIYSRKIIVATGMRAISLAHTLAICQTGITKFNTDCMYFETNDALKEVIDLLSNLQLSKQTEQKIIRHIDLNPCNINAKKMDLEKIASEMMQELAPLQDEEVIIFDYTSATTGHINKAIELFIPFVKVILLVNSGLKNEQIGADMNYYGTLRIITKVENILDYLYYGVKTALNYGNEELPKEVHNVRKAYKSIGAVVTSKAIFKKDQWDYFGKENIDVDNAKTNVDFDTEFTKIFNLFNGELSDELQKLKDQYGRDINEIISWDSEKIQNMASDEVEFAVDLFDFDEIANLYDVNSEITMETINYMHDHISVRRCNRLAEGNCFEDVYAQYANNGFIIAVSSDSDSDSDSD